MRLIYSRFPLRSHICVEMSLHTTPAREHQTDRTVEALLRVDFGLCGRGPRGRVHSYTLRKIVA